MTLKAKFMLFALTAGSLVLSGLGGCGQFWGDFAADQFFFRQID